MKRSYILLFAITALFLITRLYKISEVPVSLYWDEASIGYNAYSVLTTGRDEWGEFLPLHFRAFGEFKLPIYIYSVAIAGYIFGFGELAVRLPSVLFSLGIVLLTFLLTYKITSKINTSLYSAFLFTISPWTFIFTRTGYEAMAGLMFYVLGIYLFLLLDRRKIFLLFSTLSFILSIYSYNSFKLISPITMVILWLYSAYCLKVTLKKFLFIGLTSLVLLFLSLIPIWRLMSLDNGLSRLQAVGLTKPPDGKIGFVTGFTNNYLANFDPSYLFINGDKNLRSNQGNHGQVYWLEIPLMLMGVVFILKNRKSILFLPLIIILLSPLPAAMTKESPHALRTVSVVPFISILSAIGLSSILDRRRDRFNKVLQGLFIAVSLVLFANYLNNFFSTYPQKSSEDWQFGYRQVFLKYNSSFEKFDKVVVSDAYAQPYIFALYFLRYSPSQFRNEVKYNSVDRWGFSAVNNFGNFVFTPVKLDNLPKGRLLVFTSPQDKLEGILEKETINDLRNNVVFYVYEYQK